jgi:hypothetical protein
MKPAAQGPPADGPIRAAIGQGLRHRVPHARRNAAPAIMLPDKGHDSDPIRQTWVTAAPCLGSGPSGTATSNTVNNCEEHLLRSPRQPG